MLLVYTVLGNLKTILNPKFSDMFSVIKVKVLSVSFLLANNLSRSFVDTIFNKLGISVYIFIHIIT